jgi:hypothetical protein
MVAGQSVDQNDKGRKVNCHSRFKSTNETTALLLEVSLKAIQLDSRTRGQSVANKDALTVEEYDHHFLAYYQKVGIVLHPNLKISNVFI